jgi:Glyoxalase-like domain
LPWLDLHTSNGLGAAFAASAVACRHDDTLDPWLDIRVAGEPPWDMRVRENLIRAKVAELTAAGATAVREEFYDEHLGHVVMLDPEHNEFCVA